ncbi:MAG: hypothetical protein D6768_08120, partial [Chloroflexi bacterium]
PRHSTGTFFDSGKIIASFRLKTNSNAGIRFQKFLPILKFWHFVYNFWHSPAVLSGGAEPGDPRRLARHAPGRISVADNLHAAQGQDTRLLLSENLIPQL